MEFSNLGNKKFSLYNIGPVYSNANGSIINPIIFFAFFYRVYHVHAPRKIVVGVHPQKKTIQLSISRPHFNQPWMYFMHAQTMVTARRGLAGKPGNSHPNLRKFCPNCMSNVIITKGPEFTRDR